jgi:putative intracellular protease/amidase
MAEMTMFPQNQPEARKPSRRQAAPRRIAFLLFDGFQILDAAGPLAAFEIAGRYCEGAYRLDVIAAEGGPIASSSTATISAGAFRAAACDTLIVAGGDGTRTAFRDQRILKFVRRAAERARRVTSVCSGAFILAAAGLLDGRRATTHWSRTAEFARRFPKVRLEADRIYVKDGPVWTSAGITAGIDLALALIAEDLGEDIAKRTAQQLVVYYRRPGGQSQFSALAELGRPDGRFGARAARSAARRRATGRPRRHEPTQFRPRLHRRNGRHAGQGGRASAARSGARTGRSGRGADRRHCHQGRFRRSGADAPRLSARLRSTAASAAPHGARIAEFSIGKYRDRRDDTITLGHHRSAGGTCRMRWLCAATSSRL